MARLPIAGDIHFSGGTRKILEQLDALRRRWRTIAAHPLALWAPATWYELDLTQLLSMPTLVRDVGI